MAVDGLPAYFTDFVRWRGSMRMLAKRGPINSGEFVISRR